MNKPDGSAFVLMQKNPETGFFEEELEQYRIETDEEFIEGLYAEQTENGLMVCLRVGVADLWPNISDELFNVIYDHYDSDLLPEYVTEIIEIDECFNPVWETRFLFNEKPGITEEMIKQTLAAHRTALSNLLQENLN